MRLDMIGRNLASVSAQRLASASQKLGSMSDLLEVLSPVATLRRGYSITRVNGKAVTAASEVKPGEVIETTFADGAVKSVVK